MNAHRAQHLLRVFYRDYANGVSIASTQPESLPADRMLALADRLLVPGDNFLGMVDRNDVILQCHVADDPAEVTLELVYPEATGCLRLTLPREQALDRLDDLPVSFDETLLPGAQYID
jgi:hypothetical protein